MARQKGALDRPAVRRLGRLASLLRRARIAKNVSQFDVAARSGVALSTIERYERGLGQPSAATGLRVAAVLDVDGEAVMEAVRDDAVRMDRR